MKSNTGQLESRGYVADEAEKVFEKATYDELLEWLKEKQAIKRTIAARRLAGQGASTCVEALCIALETENKLYAKIEICNSLIKFGEKAVPDLISRLGKIGENQYTEVPLKKFGKKNYPLPRDIIARTLIRIGKPALPALLDALQSKSTKVISEAIDAIGYICFYDKQKDILPILMKCMDQYAKDDLIRWKLVRAMSAFHESNVFLEKLYTYETNNAIRQEIERSLALTPLTPCLLASLTP